MAYALLKLRECRWQGARDVAAPVRPGGRLRGARGGVAVAWCGLVLAGCFANPINRPPGVTITAPPTLLRGQPASYTVTASDPDQDRVDFSWTVLPTDCAADTGPASWPGDRMTSSPDPEVLVVPAELTRDRFCVWAFGTDAHGALGADHRAGDPQNRAPMAQIDVVRPQAATLYPLYTDFWLSGAASTDPEDDRPLTFAWSLDRAPVNSVARMGSCAGGGATDRCFFADVHGQYVVSLAVSDPLGARGTTPPLVLMVDQDQPPCIVGSDPLILTPTVVRDPTVSNDFTVDQVNDDGDPYPVDPFAPGPHGRIRFSWFVGHGDEPLVSYDNDFHALTVAPNTFLLGDSGRVRVEIHDRNVGNTGAINIDNVLLDCGDKPQCAATPGCFQRVTWNIDWTIVQQ